jgi:hypothetical protein
MIMTKQTKQPARITNVDSEAKNEIIPEAPLNEATPPSNVEEAKGNKCDKTDQGDEMNRWHRHSQRKAWIIFCSSWVQLLSFYWRYCFLFEMVVVRMQTNGGFP